jgi:uncharacterized OB-fold protein
MTDYRKPLPVPDPDSEPYWRAVREHRLEIQRCAACGTFRFYPRGVCPACLAETATWVPVAGAGTIYSYTVVHQNRMPGFKDELPYVLAVIELAEGVRMTANIVECRPEDVRIGLPVEVVFRDATPEVSLPVFRPRGQ